MAKPINTPKWLFVSQRGRKSLRLTRKQIRRSMSLPAEADLALQFHAAQLSKQKRKDISIDRANADLLYRSKLFREYLPKAREVLEPTTTKTSVKDQQSHEFQQQDSSNTGSASD